MAHELDELVTAVQASAKYRAIAPELIRTIGARELAAHGRVKAAVKETKRKLHQIAGAYFAESPRYSGWLGMLTAAANMDELRAICKSIMATHASTRERLPDLEQIYPAVFAELPPLTQVLDLACGLNPLAVPWMQLPPNCTYLACDLYTDLAEFLAAALPLLGVQGKAFTTDLSSSPPQVTADAALILKTLPVLEQIRGGAARALLQAIAAPFLIVSYPTRSLGGRNVGMRDQYTSQFSELCRSEGWPIRQTIELSGEIVFVVEKGR